MITVHCICVCDRLAGRAPRPYVINVEAARISYRTADNDIRIYMEASNGVGARKSSDYSQVLTDAAHGLCSTTVLRLTTLERWPSEQIF